MEKIFTDESNETTPPSLRIDFSESLWATDKLNSIFHNAGIPLNDVDFIVETEEELIFVGLPFELQKQNQFSIKMIDELNVMRIGEWNEKYPQFPITRLIEEICPN